MQGYFYLIKYRVWRAVSIDFNKFIEFSESFGDRLSGFFEGLQPFGQNFKVVVVSAFSPAKDSFDHNFLNSFYVFTG